MEYVEDVEDAVQFALMKALESWTANGLPDNPTAWLFRAAKNSLIGALRTRTRREDILRVSATEVAIHDVQSVDLIDDIGDDLLRMLFVCCDNAIPLESQMVFTLKTLCGFDVREIAMRLFISEANVYKRLGRARSRLRSLRPRTDELTSEQLSTRMPAVHKVLYLIFTEGYLSSHAEKALRQELCNEAIRLLRALAEHPVGQSPETCALLALMHLHIARMPARQNDAGGLLLLEEQNRSQWDQVEIQEGLKWLARSAAGDKFSRYHAEAGIAAEHCLAPSFAKTRWDKVAECYELLEQSTGSPIHRLNRAVAVAEWKGAREGLAVLESFQPPTWLAGSYLWAAAMADLQRRSGHIETAKRYRKTAIELAPSSHVKELLQRRLQIE